MLFYQRQPDPTPVTVNAALFNNIQGRWQCTCTQQQRQVSGFLDGKTAGNFTTATADFITDNGRADHFAIQNDSKRFTDVLAGNLAKAAGADCVKAESHHRGILVKQPDCR